MTSPSEPVIPAHGDRVAWGRVGLFYGIALAGSIATAALVAVLGEQWGGLTALAFGAATMLTPLVAGLVTEKVAGRTTLLRREGRALRARFWRVLGRIALATLIAYLVVVAAQALVFLATAGPGLPGAGTVATQEQFDQYLHELGSQAPSTPLAVVVASVFVQALIAGFTVNGLFGFGEEYGWRGVLAEELRPLGAVRSNVVTGTLWGFWHAPLIALGHNYGPDWAFGIPLFAAVCIPLSFVLWWSRERSGSVIAPAMVHGAFNGVAGLFLLLAHGAERLAAVPVGVYGVVALALAAVVLWRVPTRRPDAAASVRSPA